MISVKDKLPSDYADCWWLAPIKDIKFKILLQGGREFYSCFNFDSGQWVITEKNPKYVVIEWELPKVRA